MRATLYANEILGDTFGARDLDVRAMEDYADAMVDAGLAVRSGYQGDWPVVSYTEAGEEDGAVNAHWTNWLVGYMQNLGAQERDGGFCPQCSTRATLRTCSACGNDAWIIDCGHMAQPRPIAAGKADGSDLEHDYCEACAQE